MATQKDRIEDLRQQAERLSGGKMIAEVSGKLSSDAEEQFWRKVVDFETGPFRVHG
jgi:hypothetical protein